MPGYENDPPSISNHSLTEMWSQLFDHYRDTQRWRYSCQEAKWMSQVQYEVKLETIHGKVTALSSIAAFQRHIRENH